MATAFLGLGSNLGTRRRNLLRAVDALHSPYVRVHALSSCYRTEPVERRDQPMFRNAVCRVQSTLSPRQLMEKCRQIEKRLGRLPRERWGPREIDLDILYFDQLIVRDSDLTIPHPRLHQRRFVLVPMVELSPDWLDPQRSCTVSVLLESCRDDSRVVNDLEPPCVDNRIWGVNAG